MSAASATRRLSSSAGTLRSFSAKPRFSSTVMWG